MPEWINERFNDCVSEIMKKQIGFEFLNTASGPSLFAKFVAQVKKNSWSSARRANINFSLIRAKDFADKEGLIVV